MRRTMLAAVAALATAGPAAAFNDPDWPCEQRRVLHLSIGQMWSGPLAPDPDAWRADPALSAAVARLAARRTPVEEVAALADAAVGRQDRAARLALLFQGVFDSIDAERARIVEGIGRFVRKQRDLSTLIDAEQAEIARLEAETPEDAYDALEALDARRDKLAWDIRIYEERRRSLRHVCESPVLLEQRLFAIGRIVADLLAKG